MSDEYLDGILAKTAARGKAMSLDLEAIRKRSDEWVDWHKQWGGYLTGAIKDRAALITEIDRLQTDQRERELNFAAFLVGAIGSHPERQLNLIESYLDAFNASQEKPDD